MVKVIDLFSKEIIYSDVSTVDEQALSNARAMADFMIASGVSATEAYSNLVSQIIDEV